jgi:hypothetical protein
MYKPLTWRKLLHSGQPNLSWDGVLWSVKNHFEIKWASRVLVEGNLLENCWAQGQAGGSVLFNHGIPEHDPTSPKRVNGTDIMFRSNIIKNSPYGLTISTNRATLVMPSRIAFLNNLGLEMGGKWLYANHGVQDLWVEHNTFVPLQGGNSEVFLGWGPSASLHMEVDFVGGMSRFTLKRNVFGHAQYGIYIARGFTTNTYLDQMLPDRSWAENAQYDVPADRRAPLTGVTFYSSPAAAGVDVRTGHLNVGSPLLHAGSDGKDFGVDFAQLVAAQTRNADRAPYEAQRT